MDSSHLREIVRTVTVSYPVPFIFATLIAVLIFCLSGAVVVHGPLSWIFAMTGVVAFVVAVGIAIRDRLAAGSATVGAPSAGDTVDRSRRG
jgi:hypothetical protein